MSCGDVRIIFIRSRMVTSSDDDTTQKTSVMPSAWACQVQTPTPLCVMIPRLVIFVIEHRQIKRLPRCMVLEVRPEPKYQEFLSEKNAQEATKIAVDTRVVTNCRTEAVEGFVVFTWRTPLFADLFTSNC